jgi:vacuolar-type H+-ATPase subunit H
MPELAALVEEAVKAELEAVKIVEEAKRKAEELLERARIEAQEIVESALRKREVEVKKLCEELLIHMLGEVEEIKKLSKLEEKLNYLKKRREEIVTRLSDNIVKYVAGDVHDIEFS